MFVARWRSTVSNSSAASKWRLASDTTVPPPVIAMNAENWPVPCISGQATTITGASVRAGGTGGDLGGVGCRGGTGEGIAAGAEHVEQVVLAPHHALGDAGGAAGVEQQQVVARALDRRRLGTRRRPPPRTAPPSPGRRPTSRRRRTSGEHQGAARGSRRAGRRTRRGRRPPRRRRCRTGRGSRRVRSGSWCSPGPSPP